MAIAEELTYQFGFGQLTIHRYLCRVTELVNEFLNFADSYVGPLTHQTLCEFNWEMLNHSS